MKPDFIVVGAGTAGCVLANRLVGQGYRVALIEAGGGNRHMHVQIPAAFPKLFKTKRDWAFFTTAQPGLNGRKVFWPRGKMLGGSSSMNAQIHQWASAQDCARWVEMGATGWGWDDLLPAFRQVESELNGGPLREPNPLSVAFIEAAADAGYRGNGSYNGTLQQHGAWTSEVAHRNGRRWSAADAYLTKSSKLEIVTAAQVERVMFHERRATGVCLRRGGRTEIISADKGVVVCGGAVNSPQLLMLSGIGPARQLQSMGIPVVHDSPQVGSNLQDHLMFVMHFRARRPVTLRSAESPANLWRYLRARRGMLASNVAEALAFVSSQPDAPVDLEIVFAPALFEKEGLAPPSAHGFSLAPVLLAPKSRGTISLASRDPAAAPLIDPAYLSDADGEDIARLVAGTRIAQQIASRPALAKESAGMMTPRDMTEERIVEAIRQTAHTIYHPAGTCRMGADEQSVVDCNLAVRGADRLWVVDASVMPTVPRGHPNATVAAIAHVAAARIAA